MDQLVKEFYLKKKWSRETLETQINAVQDKMRNKKMTA
jgi:hypothetical protein